MPRIIILLFASVVIVSLLGCGSADSGSSQGLSPAVNQAPAEAVEATIIAPSNQFPPAPVGGLGSPSSYRIEEGSEIWEYPSQGTEALTFVAVSPGFTVPESSAMYVRYIAKVPYPLITIGVVSVWAVQQLEAHGAVPVDAQGIPASIFTAPVPLPKVADDLYLDLDFSGMVDLATVSAGEFNQNYPPPVIDLGGLTGQHLLDSDRPRAAMIKDLAAALQAGASVTSCGGGDGGRFYLELKFPDGIALESTSRAAVGMIFILGGDPSRSTVLWVRKLADIGKAPNGFTAKVDSGISGAIGCDLARDVLLELIRIITGQNAPPPGFASKQNNYHLTI